MSSLDFAHMIFQGRLTDDPEVRTLDNGNTLCKFRVASNRRIGRDEERTAFIPVTVFGNDAINCGKFLSKGRAVHVFGHFETDRYTDRDGNTRTGFGVVASEITFGPGGRMNNEEDDDEPDYRQGSYKARQYVRGGAGRKTKF